MKSNKYHDHTRRQHLTYLLSDGGAHAKFSDVVSSFPAKLRGQKPAAFPHSAWMLLEHMRIAHRDILEFSRNPKYASPEWPGGYWRRTEPPPNAPTCRASRKAFNKDLNDRQALM